MKNRPDTTGQDMTGRRGIFSVALLYRGPQHEGKDEFSSFVPAGLFNILKSLRDAGYRATIHNLSHRKPGRLAAALKKTAADAVLLSAFFGCHHEAYRLAGLAKDTLGGIPVILGGPLALLGPEILARIPAIDAVIAGEGEEAARDLLDLLLLGAGEAEHISGLIYRTPDGIRNNPALLLEEIDRYFFLPSEVLPHCHDVQPENLAVLITSRGCPYRCTFCSSTAIWRNRLRHHATDLLIDYLADLRKSTGALYFSLRDENFLANRGRVREFTEKLRRSGLSFLWNAQGSVHLLDAELARWLADAGCDQLQLGVETVSPRLMKLLGKKIDPALVRQAAKTLRDQQIRPFGYFIYGMDETAAEAEENAHFIINSGLLDAVASPLVLYPGTELARQIDPAVFFKNGEMVFYHTESQQRYRRRYEQALACLAEHGSFSEHELFGEKTAANSVAALARYYHYLNRGLHREAELVLQGLSSREPRNPWPLTLLAEFYEEQGRRDRAERLREKAGAVGRPTPKKRPASPRRAGHSGKNLPER